MTLVSRAITPIDDCRCDQFHSPAAVSLELPPLVIVRVNVENKL